MTRLALFLVFVLCAAGARADIVADVLGCKGDPCVIEHSRGGKIALFQEAGYAVDQGARKLVVIDGLCASACVLFADIARSRICITESARFGVHQYRTPAWRNRKDSPQVSRAPCLSGDIIDVAEEHGGFPEGKLNIIAGRHFVHIWRRCP
jgi:hypothetical protein